MMDIEKDSLSCLREGLTIRGTVFRPVQDGKYPAAIISHGFRSDQRSVIRYAEQLAQWGYAAVCFDFCGGCARGTSDGKTEDMTVLTEVRDLCAVIDHVKSMPFVLPDKLILMGCSQGGFVSALAAARRGAEIEKLILFYPALCIPDDARAGRMAGVTFDPQHMPEILSKFPMKIGKGYAETVLKMDPIQEITPYPGPVLLVHGVKDKVVSISYSRKAQAAYGAHRSCLVEIPGAGHGFKPRADRIAVSAVQSFLNGTTFREIQDEALVGLQSAPKGLLGRIAVFRKTE